MFIKKIFEGNVDNLVHLQFQKFSKGNFKNKAMIKASHSKDKYSIATTAEYANELVRMLSEKIMNNKIHVSGAVITTMDLTGKLDFKDKKQFMGVKQYIMDSDMSGTEILDLCNKLPLAFMALSFKFGNYELKIKAKAPKSAKPSTKGEAAPKIDFCKFITTDKSLVSNILFDINLDSFKKVEITHEFVITDLILPKNETDFAKIREMAKRKGKIIRKINLDGKEIVKEKEFEA